MNSDTENREKIGVNMVSAQEICTIISKYGDLAICISKISEDDCLFDNGLDSFSAVQAMMDLEEHFNVEVPEDLMSRENFSTIKRITDLVSSLICKKIN